MVSAFVDMEDEFEENPSSSSMTEGLLDGDDEGPKKEGWAKYEGYFDVDTADIIKNLKAAILPKPGLSLASLDLYGPFWIAITLIFSSSLAADLRYDFDGISLASGFFFPYLCLCPLTIYGTFLWKQIPLPMGVPELISIYGYALLPFIPLTLLLIIPLPNLAHGLLIAGGTIWSSATLGLLLWSQLPGPFKHFFVALHYVIMFIFFYFFTRAPYPSPTTVPESGATKVAIVGNATHSS